MPDPIQEIGALQQAWLQSLFSGYQSPEELLKIGITMEAAAIHHSLLYESGRPGAAVAPTPGLNGAALTSYAGQIPFRNPAAGKKSKLAKVSASVTVIGQLLICDRLWHNSGYTITTTTEELTTHPGLPARCQPVAGNSDSDPDANGDGVMCAIEVSTATTNAGAITNTTLNYTDVANGAGRTGTIASFPATAAKGTFVPFQLAAGDRGVKSIQGLTKGTSYAAGVIHLVQYRVLARISLNVANVGAVLNALELGLPRMYDNTVPFLVWLPTATTAITLSGEMLVAHV